MRQFTRKLMKRRLKAAIIDAGDSMQEAKALVTQTVLPNGVRMKATLKNLYTEIVGGKLPRIKKKRWPVLCAQPQNSRGFVRP